MDVDAIPCVILINIVTQCTRTNLLAVAERALEARRHRIFMRLCMLIP